jgi:predicted nucleotidyltransferase
MKSDEIIATLRAHETELKAAGVLSLSLIGSFARGDAHDDSDIDIVVRLSDDPKRRGFRFFGRIEELSRRLEAIVKRPVDVITEPVHNERLRRGIAEDRKIAF